MKKFTTLLCMAALLVNMAALTGCNSNEEGSDIPSGSGSSAVVDSSDSSGSSDNSDGSDSSDSSDGSDNSESDPEPQKPDGEPTFLTAPDGTPIYTSEISEVYKGSEEWGNKETITFEQAEQFAKDGSDFTVKCDGFVYGYIPERALNHVDNPEMFEDIGSGSFKYLGEVFDVNNFEGKYSTEYMRIKVGDKFGSLTVKNAYTLFSRQIWYEGEDFSDVPGVYLSDCCVEFDGEIEMTGYVDVTRMETLYGSGGDMKFYPDGDSSVIIPNFGFALNKKARCVCHFPYASGLGYCGTSYDIGNMYKVDCDTSGLQPGDSFVKVKVVLDNVRYAPGFQLGGWKLDLKSIEVL